MTALRTTVIGSYPFPGWLERGCWSDRFRGTTGAGGGSEAGIGQLVGSLRA